VSSAADSAGTGADWCGCPQDRAAECELRYVIALPTRAERAEYLDRAERWDGSVASAALRREVREAWAHVQEHTPIPCRCAAAAVCAVHSASEQAPATGPSHATPLAGPLRRVGGVDSGAAGR
jgi:hypothetical protein